MKSGSFKIDLLIDMASIFSEFMLNYSQEIGKAPLTNYEAFKLHNEMTNVYAGEAIKLMFERIKDENVEVGFDDWLKEHGFGEIKKHKSAKKMPKSKKRENETIDENENFKE